MLTWNFSMGPLCSLRVVFRVHRPITSSCRAGHAFQSGTVTWPYPMSLIAGGIQGLFSCYNSSSHLLSHGLCRNESFLLGFLCSLCNWYCQNSQAGRRWRFHCVRPVFPPEHPFQRGFQQHGPHGASFLWGQPPPWGVCVRARKWKAASSLGVTNWSATHARSLIGCKLCSALCSSPFPGTNSWILALLFRFILKHFLYRILIFNELSEVDHIRADIIIK